MWKRLHHPNIVPFVGVPAGDPTPAIIYDWMEHGGIAEYVRQHPEGDQMGLRLVSEFILSSSSRSNAEGHSCGTWRKAFITCTCIV